jgi:outer membrane biosynthesis protein TonB
MKLARVLVPVALAWAALTGCGDAPEARRDSRTPRTARSLARHETREAAPRGGDPILESIRLLAARKKGGAGARPGEGPSLAEMLPPLRSASVPYDIAAELDRSFATPARRAVTGPKETPAGKVAAAPREAPARAKETPPTPKVKPPTPKGIPPAPKVKPSTPKETPPAPKVTPSKPKEPPARKPEGPTPPPGERAGKASGLVPGDELELKVSGQPEFSGAVKVREDGTVALPSTGDPVPASGKSVEEFARAVAEAIWPRYVKRKPAVAVKVLRSMRSREGGTP